VLKLMMAMLEKIQEASKFLGVLFTTMMSGNYMCKGVSDEDMRQPTSASNNSSGSQLFSGMISHSMDRVFVHAPF
jgi:hypothetical protein